MYTSFNRLIADVPYTKFMGITVSAHNKVFLDSAGKIVRSESESKAMGKTSTSVQTIRYHDSIRVTAPN